MGGQEKLYLIARAAGQGGNTLLKGTRGAVDIRLERGGVVRHVG